MTGNKGDDVEDALAALITAVEGIGGAYFGEFSLEHWAGVERAEQWCCTVAGDIRGDDGDRFSILGHSAADALRRAAEETVRRSAE